MSDNIRDYTSIYNIKDFIHNQVAPKYFNVDELSTLNVGMYGMTTDIASTVIEDNFRVTSRYITEMLPGKSRLPEFIYANAANFGITNVFAQCATCTAILFIKEDDVIHNSIKKNDTREYIIDSDLTVYVEDIPYSIPYNIKIQSRYYNNSYHHNCMYDESINNSVSIETSPYIKCVKTRVTGESKTYLALTITLYQYQRKRTTESIITNSKLNIPFIEVPFSDNICNFEVLYTSPNSTIKKQLLKHLETVPATIKPFTYYKMVDEGLLRLSFTNDDRYFIPEYNSELEILMYETKGSAGVFKQYKGDDVYVEGKSEDPQLEYNNKVPLQCIIMSDSVNGKDSPTLDELRILTWEKQLTINSYTTEADLNQHFLSYASIHKSQATFVKTRDDYSNRSYACHTRLQDDDGNIFPTNTLSLDVTFDKIGGFHERPDTYIIKPGTPIGYSSNSRSMILDENQIENADIVYTSIALMSIEIEPNSIAYYMNSVAKTIPMVFDTVNEYAVYQFICRSFNISRSAVLGEDSYNITVSIVPSDISLLTNEVFNTEEGTETPYIEDDEGSNIEIDTLQSSKIKVFLFFNTGIGHYIELSYDASKSSTTEGFVFTCSITTNDVISGDTIELTNLFATTSDLIHDCSVNMMNPDVKLLVFYKDELNKTNQYADIIKPTEGLTLTNTFLPKEGELYFAYQLSLIQSSVTFLPCADEPFFYMSITDVPLFLRSFLMDTKNTEIAIDRVNTQYQFIMDSLRGIVSNFSIHMKFFNTCGRSTIFTVTDGSLLNRTNCDIKLGLKFVEGIEPDQYMSNIKYTIKTFIESLNDYDKSGINSINISELIQELHNTYEDIIRYIVFYSLNGYDSSIQNIFMNQDLSSSDNKDAILEFLTIDIKDIDITIL